MHGHTYDAVLEHILRARHILLVTDERSDGDTFGSSLAFASYLAPFGCKITHYASSEILESLHFLPGMHRVTQDAAVLENEEIDLVMVFDSSRETFLKERLGSLLRRAPLVVFDHHASNTHFGDVNVVNAEASSTCEVVYDYLRHHRAPITRDIAKCLIAGLMTDTGMLTNPMTSHRAMEKASHLLMAGGNMKDVLSNVVRSTPVTSLQLWGRVLERLTYVSGREAAITYVTQQDLDETGTDNEALSELADFFGSRLDTKIVFFLKDLDGRDGVKVSMRANGVDSTKISKLFPGGGGHKGASGFTVQGKIEVVDGVPTIV